MANSILHSPWVLDTAGIISNSPVCISKLVFYPNAVSNAVQIYSYEAGVAEATGSATVTVTSTAIVTDDAGAAFTTAYGVGDVFEVVNSTGAAGNLGKWMIGTAGDNAHFHVLPATLTNEANKLWNYNLYTGYLSAEIMAGVLTGDTEPRERDYTSYAGGGLWVPNFLLKSITAGTLYVFVA